MKAVSARVLNGQIVLDEPIELPEGTTVQVLLTEPDELTAEERAELEAAIEEGADDFERGDYEDARAFALRLAATT
ncbi:MAG TPA: hypothetical protein VNO30_46510 [Kofleriaceae bacterium]|nr:hypothetical protein [Kofleriaceae bacterium]